MTIEAELLALADRVERLAKPCRDTDAKVALITGLYTLEKRGSDRKEWFYPTSPSGYRKSLYAFGYECLERYTASIDAGLTLTPSDCAWDVDASAPELGIDWRIYPAGTMDSWCAKGVAATPALALTAAALRARAQDAAK